MGAALMFKRMIYDHIIPYTDLENMIKEGSVQSVLLGQRMMLCYMKSSNIKYGIAGFMGGPN